MLMPVSARRTIMTARRWKPDSTLMSDFIDDAIGLYQTMSGTTWE